MADPTLVQANSFSSGIRRPDHARPGSTGSVHRREVPSPRQGHARTWRHLGDDNPSKPRNSQQAAVIRETGRGNSPFPHPSQVFDTIRLIRRVVEAAGVEPVPANFITGDGAGLPTIGRVPPRNLLPSTSPGVPWSPPQSWRHLGDGQRPIPTPLPTGLGRGSPALLFRRLQRFGPALALPSSVNRHTLRVAQRPGCKTIRTALDAPIGLDLRRCRLRSQPR